MEKNFLIGRSNFALTVFVPSDCPRDCAFCTSKQMYKEHGPFDRESAIVSALTYLEKVNRNNRIRDVVFTGGEPMTDIESLRLMIGMVPHKNVYINTLLINKSILTKCGVKPLPLGMGI